MNKRWSELLRDITDALPSIIISALIIIVVSILRLELYDLLALLVIGTGIYDGIRNYYRNQLPTRIQVIKQLSMLTFYVILTTYVWVLSGAWGLIGMLIATTIVAGIIIYRRWDQYMASIRHIEKLIWGESLDRKKR